MDQDKKIQNLELKLLEKDKKLDEQREKLKACQGICCQVESPFLLQLIAAHLRNKNVKRVQNRKWTLDNKLLCLNLLKRGTPAYEFLYNQEPTCFASERTCQRLFSEISMEVGTNDDYFEALGKKVASMGDPRAIFCILEADEVSISPIPVYDSANNRIYGYQNYGQDAPHLNTTDVANKALVFMIQGMHIPWVQPLATYFNRGGIKGPDLKDLVMLIIAKLRKVGLIVKAFVSDQAKPNCLAMDLLRGQGLKKNVPALPKYQEPKKTIVIFAK